MQSAARKTDPSVLVPRLCVTRDAQNHIPLKGASAHVKTLHGKADAALSPGSPGEENVRAETGPSVQQLLRTWILFICC